MKRSTLLAAAALALALAACDAGRATAPDPARGLAGPAANGGGLFGSGGFTPPPDSTHP